MKKVVLIEVDVKDGDALQEFRSEIEGALSDAKNDPELNLEGCSYEIGEDRDPAGFYVALATHDIYARLHLALADMIEGGRLSEAVIPDDFKAIKGLLEEAQQLELHALQRAGA